MNDQEANRWMIIKHEFDLFCPLIGSRESGGKFLVEDKLEVEK